MTSPFTSAPGPGIGIVVLGCDKNTADAEHFAGTLEQRLPAGSRILALSAEPDDTLPALEAVVIFTCGFIHDAKTESIETILAWTAAKAAFGTPRRVYVAGCLSERYREELTAEIPEADGFVGLHEVDTLLTQLCHDNPGARRQACDVLPARKRLDDKPYAFLKVADGCDRACTFCVIPDIKGPFASVPRERLLEEAAQLVQAGVKELNLVAQDTTAYGRDLYPEYRLADLLGDLCAIPGDFWIRCLYCYPSGITDALIAQLATQSKIAPYLDIPLQHASADMLKAMGRPERPGDIRTLIARLRGEVPGIALRTTMMTGFPGETEEDHEAMLAFIEEHAFEWLGAFTYSPEEGSAAAGMKRQVPDAVARRRHDAVMQTQAAVTERFNRLREGQRTRLLIEAYDADMGVWKCRSRAEAPEVDGAILLEHGPPLTPGTFVEARLTRASLYDIYARLEE